MDPFVRARDRGAARDTAYGGLDLSWIICGISKDRKVYILLRLWSIAI